MEGQGYLSLWREFKDSLGYINLGLKGGGKQCEGRGKQAVQVRVCNNFLSK